MHDARHIPSRGEGARGGDRATWTSLRADPAQVDVAAVGAKAHVLMQLNQLGLRVPDGVVLDAALQRGCEHEDGFLARLVAELPQLDSARLMIRSSGVGEDGASASFAGQLDSYQVDNDPEAVRVGIVNCWRSAANAQVASYQQSQGARLGGVAVIVQELVEPDYAGVYFTAHPSVAGRDLVEYVEGHCEQLVSGAVTPESASLPSESLPFDGEALRAAGARVKAKLQGEQDIEWLVKDGLLYLVQARPITGARCAVTWSSTNLNENYPDPLSPLLHSIARRAYYHYFKGLSRCLGTARAGDGEELFANIIGTWGERMYYNMSHVHAVIRMSPLGAALAPAFDDFVGFQDPSLRREAGRRHGWLAKAAFFTRCATNYLRLSGRVRRIERRVEAFAAREIHRDALSELFHEFLDIRFHGWVDASFADFYAMAWHGLLGRHLERVGVAEPRGVQNTLLQAIPGLVSTGPVIGLWELRQLVRAEGLTPIFAETEAPELWRRMQVEAGLAAARRAIESHLDQWGFRCAGELTFLSQNHREDPVSFLRMFQAYLATEEVGPADVMHKMRTQQQQAMRAACDEIRAASGPVRSMFARLTLRLLVRGASRGIGARERVRLKQAQLYYQLKKVCQAFGAVLEAHEVLERADDVFFLEYDEISRLLNSDEVRGTYWRDLVKLRRSKHAGASEHPENLRSVAFAYGRPPLDADAFDDGEGGLRGLPACGGKVRGRAVVLDSIHEVGQLQRGDILVTRQTDPGWVCAFPLIAGLVVERGGMLSHGAIVAREFGVPAVVGVKGAVDRLQSGERVEVDGDLGCVRLLEESAST